MGMPALGFLVIGWFNAFNQFVRGLSLSRPRATAPSSEGAEGQHFSL